MVIVAFPPEEKYAVDYTTLDQYDYGQILRIQGLKLPKTVEVHFSTQETGGTSIPRVGVTKDGVTDVLIPDSVLENGDTTQNYSIFAFVYVTDATSGKTEYRAKLEVKARPKPEVPGGGDNPDIFHEAVLEVRKSAEKAEEAQKQAEGYAHGREDLPECAEDNAKYYSGKASEDAKKTAQDRVEVERLTESNTQMQGEVAKDLEEVKKLSSQAQTSATNAALSEQKSKEAATRAETAQTGAETAEDNAELAAQKTGQDKTAVEQAKKLVQQMGQEVLDNKNAVDKTVQDFNLAAQQALADVNNAGQTQAERVQTAGTTAVENIENAQNTATQAVETAKAEAIKTVADKGKEVLEAIPNFDAKLDTKLDKNQGAEHAGKALVIGEDGNVVPGEVQTEGVGDVADAILNTATGNLLLIKDSAERKNKGFGMVGKTEQETTTGAQLFDAEKYKNVTQDGVTISVKDGVITATGTPTKNAWINAYIPVEEYKKLFKAGKLTIKANQTADCNFEFGFYGNYGNPIVGTVKNTATLPENIPQKDTDAYFFIEVKADVELKGKIKPMVYQIGNGDYELYTGGKSSPSPEYPQEIVNAGRLNEDTGKYEVDVKVTGKNIVNIPDISADTPGGTILCRIVDNAVVSAQEKAVASSDVWHICFYSKDGKKQYFNGTETHKAITATPKNPIVKLEYRNVYITSGAYKGIMVEYGTVATPYEPYKEQTLTLTSDRPLTKWDRLVEQDGQIGWLYNTGEIMLSEIALWSVQKDNLPDNRTQRIYAILDNAIKNQHCYATKYYSEEPSVSSIKHKDYECITICNGNYLTLKVDRNIGTTSEDYVNYFRENDDKVIYNSTEQEFVPLPQEQQNAIRALQTYYPTTVVSNSEDMEMELTYVADTKNYTDRKIEEAVSAQTQNLANLLSLMPLSTQAAMIEADTNNILDNMEVQK